MGSRQRRAPLTVTAAPESLVPPGAPDGLRIGTCSVFLEWVFENVEAWTAGESKDGAALILLSIFARSARTYEAIVRCLGEAGFGEQGLMLNRSLFEDMIDAHWVSLNRALAVNRLQDHDLYSRLLRADTQRRFPRWFDGRKPPKIEVSNAERERLRLLFGKSGSGSWTGIRGADERVKAVKECWGEDGGQEALLFWAAWVQKMMNEVLHPSAFSLARIGSPTWSSEDGNEERLQWRFGSTTDSLGRSLYAAYWTFGQTVALIVDEFEPSSRSEFDERFARDQKAFEQANHWEATGRLEMPPDPAPGQ